MLFAFVLPVIAQEKDKKSPTEKAASKTAEMVTELKLNKDQEGKLFAINLKAYQTIGAYADKNKDKDLRKKQKDIVQKYRDLEYKKILTVAQYNTFEASHKKEKELDEAKKKLEKELEKKSGLVEKKKDKKKGNKEEE
jgi:hypothetical protein